MKLLAVLVRKRVNFDPIFEMSIRITSRKWDFLCFICEKACSYDHVPPEHLPDFFYVTQRTEILVKKHKRQLKISG